MGKKMMATAKMAMAKKETIKKAMKKMMKKMMQKMMKKTMKITATLDLLVVV